MSRPLGIGTVVPRPSAWRYCACEPALTYQHKSEPGQQATDFVGFANRDGTHDSGHRHTLGAQKFRLEPWLAIFE